MNPAEMDIHAPIFAIAQAAELAEMHPQTLRQYDRIGLVVPQRTRGNTRRYSLYDIEQLREVARLSAEGVSLAGIQRVLELQNQVQRLQRRVQELERAVADAALADNRRVFAAGPERGEIVTITRGKRVRRSGELVIWRRQQP